MWNQTGDVTTRYHIIQDIHCWIRVVNSRRSLANHCRHISFVNLQYVLRGSNSTNREIFQIAFSNFADPYYLRQPKTPKKVLLIYKGFTQLSFSHCSFTNLRNIFFVVYVDTPRGMVPICSRRGAWSVDRCILFVVRL